MQNRGKRLVILGGGESGVGTAVLGKQQGYEVFLSDKGALQEKYKDVLLKLGIEFEELQHTEALILNADVVVKSPGIPDKVELIKNLRNKGVPVISEIEFASWYTDAKIIGITGSNGKTTTTSLTYHILKSCGLNAGLGGNIGKSFAWQVAEKAFDFYVLELSSFQLDGLEKMKLDISVLLNITPDHLDRYDYKFDNYIDSKFQIIKNVDENSVFIFNKDDQSIVNKLQNLGLTNVLHGFSIKDNEGVSAWIENDNILIDINNLLRISNDDSPLKGKHNKYNIMAASMVAKVLGLKDVDIVKAISSFEAIEHRLEKVRVLKGVEYINDSKATNVDSVWYALECMNNRVIWIAGGVDKGNDYSVLLDLVKSKVKGLVCLGTDNQKLHSAFGGVIEQIEDASSAEEAVLKATAMAKPGYQVLLSPACASFDLFKNYEDRGNKYKQAISKLNE